VSVKIDSLSGSQDMSRLRQRMIDQAANDWIETF
jgi:hypothetical protein